MAVESRLRSQSHSTSKIASTAMKESPDSPSALQAVVLPYSEETYKTEGCFCCSKLNRTGRIVHWIMLVLLLHPFDYIAPAAQGVAADIKSLCSSVQPDACCCCLEVGKACYSMALLKAPEQSTAATWLCHGVSSSQRQGRPTGTTHLCSVAA
jgi:hypothetical protein